MPFNAGAIVGKAKLDTTSWNSGLKSLAKGTAAGMAVIGVAIGVAMTKAIKKADGFQKAMSNINTIVDETAINTQQLAKSLIQLDPALGNTTELTQGMYQAFSAGAETAKEAMDITVQSAKFAKAGLTDTFTAVDVLTTAINAYGKENMSAEMASDLLFNTIKRGKVTGEELASSLGKSIPLYASVGIGMDELTAGMASMTKVGINANIATTQLNAIVNAFVKPSGEMTAALERQGYASGAAFLEAEGLAGALDLLQAETGGEADALGKLVPNVRGMKGVMALARDGASEFTKVLEEQQNVVGVTDEAFQEQEKTFDTLKNSMDKIQTVAGNIGKHFVDKIAVGAITAGKGMLDFIMSSRGMDLVASIAEVAAGAFEFLKTTLEVLIENILPPLQGLWDTITESIQKVTGETEKGAGATRIWAGALNLVSIAFDILIKMADITITAIADIVVAIKSSVEPIGTFFQMLKGDASMQDVKDSWKNTGDAFRNLGGNIVEGFTDLITSSVDKFKNFGEDTNVIAMRVTTSVQQASSQAREYITSNWGEILTGQTDFLGEYLASQKATNDEMQVDTEETVYNMEATFKDYFKTILSGAQSLVSDMSSVSSMMHDNEIAMMEYEAEQDNTILAARYEQNLITEDEYNKALEEQEKQKLIKLNAAKKKAFEDEKKFQIVDAIMSGASAIMGWWSAATSLGPIAGPIFGIAMTAVTAAMTIAQIATISQQQYVPAKAAGGMASGLTRINEEGGELVVLPDKSVVVPHDLSQQIAGGNTSSQNILNVSFAGANISDDMSLNKIVDRVSKQLGKQLRAAS